MGGAVEDISISEPVRRQLRAALLEELDLITSIQENNPTEVDGEPGSFTCDCTVAVRRPLDPETAELRELHVRLRKMETGWLVSQIEGLTTESEVGEPEP
jgi:hypothetical protein